MDPVETRKNRLIYDAVPVRTQSFQTTSFPVWPHQHTVLHFLRRWGGHLRPCSILVSKVDQKTGRVPQSGGNIGRRQHSAKDDTRGKVLGSCPGHDQEDFKGKNAWRLNNGQLKGAEAIPPGKVRSGWSPWGFSGWTHTKRARQRKVSPSHGELTKLHSHMVHIEFTPEEKKATKW